jgi:outer membrane lipoprotein-sorting protein
MVTREGSSMRNEFSNVRVNEKVDKKLFEYDLTGFDITEEKK